MTITSDLNSWWATLSNYNESNSAKAKFQDIVREIDQMLNELQQMSAQGDFDSLPAAAISKATWIWQQLNAARNAVKADAGAMEFINWTP